MTDEAKQARREYQRKWNREHRDRCKAYHDKYWERKAAGLVPAREPSES